MDFAKNLMKKYGWKEGEGLGKNNDGMSKPLKANFKFDNSGLGLDKASDFKNHWWERVFNEAANNIKVQKTGDSIQISTENEDAVEITTNSFSTKKLKKQIGHNGFLKTSTLTGLGNEVDDANKVNVEVLALSNYKPLTDEELFAACEGRTAHKGARHGLYLTGKLSRIEQQEREFLAKLEKQSEKCEDNEWIQVKKKKKRKQEEMSEPKTNSMASESINGILYQTDYSKSKKKKKESKKMDKELSTAFTNVNIELDVNTKNAGEMETRNNGKRKKKHKEEIENDGHALQNSKISKSGRNSMKPKKKKKKKDEVEDGDTSNSTKDDFLKQSSFQNSKNIHLSKKKLKRKMKMISEDVQEALSLTCSA